MENKNTFLNRESSPDVKKKTREAVFDELSSALFDKVSFVTLIFSEALNLDGTPIVSTTNFIGTSRITDTSEGRYTNAGKVSRMRCSFYVSNANKLQGYIISPAVYDSFSSLNSFSSMSLLRSYVGIYFNSGPILVAVKEAGKQEVLYPTTFSFSGTGATDTYELEVRHEVRFTEIYINKILVGTYSTDLLGNFQSTKTFLPLFSPARSTDGSAVGIVIENFQFIQDR